MILDIIILVILIVPMALGLFRGFLYMLLHTLSWVAALTAAFFLTGPVAAMLGDGFVGNMVSESISQKADGSSDFLYVASEGLPDIMRGGLMVTADSVSDIFVNLMTSAIVSVISFLLIVFLIKLVLRLLVRPVTKRRSGTLISGADKLLGLAVGFMEGILLVFIFLALLVVIVNFTWGGNAAGIVSSLEDSVIAGALYDNNLLLLITGGIFS